MLRKRNTCLSTLGSLLLAAACLFPALQAAGAQRPAGDSKEVSDLLSQAKDQSVQLKNDASDMESFTRSTVSWEGHAEKITAIKEDVNKVGETVTKLNNARSMASPWQKTAIDRINPLLKELADNTTSIIDHLTREQGRLLNTQEHKDLLKSNADLAADLSAVIGDFVDYGQTKAKYFELRRKLEISERRS